MRDSLSIRELLEAEETLETLECLFADRPAGREIRRVRMTLISTVILLKKDWEETKKMTMDSLN